MWQFVLTDLLGVPHGDLLSASQRQVSLPHMRVPSASAVIPLSDPLSDVVMSSDCLLKAYRTDPVTGQKNLAFHGPVIGAEEVGNEQGQSVAITATGPFWRLTKRIIPGSKLKSGIQYGSATELLDLGLVAHKILEDTNAVVFTGIVPGSRVATTTGWVGRWWLKNAAEGIAELHAGVNSFEYLIRPTEPTVYANPALNWPRIATMDVAPMIGQVRPDAVFEYGTSRGNVASYSRSRSHESMLTNAIISVNGWPDALEKLPDGTPKYDLIERPDLTAIAAHGGYEEVVNDGGVLDNALRTSIADFHLALRKEPRLGIVFSVRPDARPAPFVDYEVGDVVRARAERAGVTRFDALFRIWGVSFSIDQNGVESVDLELVMP